MATTFDNVVSYPPAMPDVERMLSINTSVLEKLDAAHKFVFELFTEEEKANPVVYLPLVHVLMSIDSMSNEVRIDSHRYEQTLKRLREIANAKHS